MRALVGAAQVALSADQACFGRSNYSAACFPLAFWPPQQQKPFPSTVEGKQLLWHHFSLGRAHKCGIELYTRQGEESGA